MAAAFALVWCLLHGAPLRAQERDEPAESRSTGAANDSGWGERETRLANQYLRLLQANPENDQALSLLWDLYQNHGSVDLLVAHFAAQRANPVAELIYGHLLRRTGALEEADEVYGAILRRDPENRQAVAALVELSVQRGRLEQAIELLRASAVRADGTPAAADQWFRLADLLLEQGRDDEAVDSIDKAVTSAGGGDEARLRAATALRQVGRIDRAIANLDAVFARTGDPARRLDLLRELSRLHRMAGDFERAADALRSGMAATHHRHHVHHELFRSLVRLYEEDQRTNELEDELTEAALAPDAGEAALLAVVDFYRFSAQPSRQLEWARRLHERFPAAVEHQQALADCLVENDAYDEAAAVLDDLLARTGERSLTLRLLRCEIDGRRGRRQEAGDRLDAIIRDFGVDGEAGERILAFAESHYFDAAAERLLENRAVRSPDSPDAVFAFTRFLLARTRESRAREVLEKYVEGSPHASADDRARRTLEVTRFLLGIEKLELAQAFGQRATESGSSDPDALLQLAEIHFEKGERDEAVRRLQEAWRLATDPLDRQKIDQKILSYLEHAFLERQQTQSDRARRIDLFFPGSSIARPERSAPAGTGEETSEEGRREGLHAEESFAFAAALAAEASRDDADPATVFRAAWWAFRTDDYAAAYEWMRRLVEIAPQWKDVAFLQLQLELARASGNGALAERTLSELRSLDQDPGRAALYARQLADHKLERGLFDDAIAILEEEIARFPYEPQLLEALTIAYSEAGRPDDVLTLWTSAFEGAPDAVARAGMLEPYTTALTMRGEAAGALDAVTRVIREEPDIEKRRRLLERQTAIVNASANGVGSASPRELLERLRAQFRELQARNPFDPFYAEALAQVHEALGDEEAALASLRQAYYNAADPSAPVLEKLRDMALAQGDAEGALGFQRQLIFTTGKDSDIAEWRVLVRMLDEQLRLDDADRIRERLERRFSGDPEVLVELRTQYLAAGRSEPALRVAARLAELRPWHLRDALERALLLLDRARPREALDALRPALAAMDNDDESAPPPGVETADFLDWPFAWEDGTAGIDVAVPGSGVRRGVAELLETNSFFRPHERNRLSDHLKRVRVDPELVPSEAGRVRLAAVTAAARAVAELGGAELEAWLVRWRGVAAVDPVTAFRALHFAGAEDEAFTLAWNRLTDDHSEGALFACSRLAVIGRQAEAIDAWLAEDGLPPAVLERRRRYLAGTMELMSALAEEAPESDFVRILVEKGTLRAGDVWELAVAAYGAGRPRDALELGALAMDAPPGEGSRGETGYHLMFAEWARQTGDYRARREHLRNWLTRRAAEAESGRGAPVRNLRGDAVRIFAELGSLLRWTSDPTERERLLELGRSLAGEGRIRGLDPRDTGVDRIALTERLLPLSGSPAIRIPGHVPVARLPRSQDFRSPAEFWHEMSDAVSIWEFFGGPEIGSAFADALDGATVPPFPGDAGDDFYADFSSSALLRRIGGMAPAERRRFVQRHLAARVPDRSEVLAVALMLGAYGYDREAIPLFERMVELEPGEAQHAQYLVGACEASGDLAPLLRYYQRVIIDNDLRVPGNPRAESFAGDHGRALRRAGAEDELRRFAAEAPAVPSARGSLNRPEVPYLAELAGLLQDSGRPGESVAVLEELVRGLAGPTDMAAIRLAHALRLADRVDEAVAILERLDLAQVPDDMVAAAAADLARLYRLSGRTDDLRRLAAATVSLPDPSAIPELARESAKAGLQTEALALLELAGRGASAKPLAPVQQWEIATTALEILGASEAEQGASALRGDALEASAAGHFERMLRFGAPSDGVGRRLAAVAIAAPPDGPLGRAWMNVRESAPRADSSVAALGDVLFGMPDGVTPRPVDALADAVRVTPGMIDAALEVLLERKRFQPAERLWRRAVARGPAVAPKRPWHLAIFARSGHEEMLGEAVRTLMLEPWPHAPYGPEAATVLADVGRPEWAERLFEQLWAQLRPANRTWAVAREEASLTGRWFEDVQFRMLRVRMEFADLLERYTGFLVERGRMTKAEDLLIEGWDFLPPGRAAELIHAFYHDAGVPRDERDRRLGPFHLTIGVQQAIELLDSGPDAK